MKKHFFLLAVVIFGLFWVLISCSETVYTPKPRAYFRISLKDSNYSKFENKKDFSFEYSNRAYVDKLDDLNKKGWLNVVYPVLNAVIFAHYISLDTAKLSALITDSRTAVFKQAIKADDVITYDVIDSVSNVYGQIYESLGNDAACSYQFWITDQKKHFFRASLYLNTTPQNDSLAPVVAYLKKDMLHLINTFQWKK